MPPGDPIVKFAAIIEYIQDKEKIEKLRPSHRQYLRTLLETGKLFATGPFTDNYGALIVYEAETLDKAEELLKGDPFHPGGIFVKWQIRPWNVVMGNASLMPG
jgi:uncharacterized protein YciI